MEIIIVGGGQIGSYIAGLLLKNNHTVKVIENRVKAIENYKKSGLPEECLVIGDGTDIEVLEKANIRTCEALVCVTGLDEVNLTTAMLAKFEYGVLRVIARVNNPKNAWLFNTGMGVDVKINQADIIGHMIADEMNYHQSGLNEII
ncbi:MAG: potassium channel family protein [Thomasclavelia ramosa]